MGWSNWSHSRGELYRGFVGWAVAHGLLISGAAAGMLAAVVLSYVLLIELGRPGPGSWWALGVVQMFVVGAVAHLVRDAYITHDRGAMRHLRGSRGEDNTRSELAIARRRRTVWGSVHSISLQRGDLDHLAVLRRGGVVVLDSKWRSELVDLDDVVRSARRARTRAEGVLRTVERHGGRGSPTSRLPVTAVVVVWGPAQHDLGRPRVVDGVTLVPGRQLRSWLRQVHGEAVPRDTARELLGGLADFGAGTRRARATATPRWRRLTPGASAPSAR